MSPTRSSIGLSFLEKLDLWASRAIVAWSADPVLMRRLIEDSYDRGQEDPKAYFHALDQVIRTTSEQLQKPGCGVDMFSIQQNAAGALENLSHALERVGYVSHAVIASGRARELLKNGILTP